MSKQTLEPRGTVLPFSPGSGALREAVSQLSAVLAEAAVDIEDLVDNSTTTQPGLELSLTELRTLEERLDHIARLMDAL